MENVLVQNTSTRTPESITPNVKLTLSILSYSYLRQRIDRYITGNILAFFTSNYILNFFVLDVEQQYRISVTSS